MLWATGSASAEGDKKTDSGETTSVSLPAPRSPLLSCHFMRIRPASCAASARSKAGQPGDVHNQDRPVPTASFWRPGTEGAPTQSCWLCSESGQRSLSLSMLAASGDVIRICPSPNAPIGFRHLQGQGLWVSKCRSQEYSCLLRETSAVSQAVMATWMLETALI